MGSGDGGDYWRLVELARVDQGYTGEEPVTTAGEQGIELKVIKLPQVKKSLMALPGRWVVERSLGRKMRLCCLAPEFER